MVATAGIAALPPRVQAAACKAVAAFDGFDPACDPYGEHDFGALDVAGQRVMFKIDYYDLDLERHSNDPADPAVTARVMTIMLADEY